MLLPRGWSHGKLAGASRSRNRSRFVCVTFDIHGYKSEALLRIAPGDSGGAEYIVPFGGRCSAFRSHVWYHEQSWSSVLTEMSRQRSQRWHMRLHQ